MKWTCRDVEALIDRRRAGLADAERLVLEQHLSECESCREVADLMREVVTTIEQAESSLSDAARERAFAKAFANVEAGGALRATRAAPKRIGLWLSAAAALIVIGRASLDEPEATQTPSARATPHDQRPQPEGDDQSATSAVAAREAVAAHDLPTREAVAASQPSEPSEPRGDARWVDVPKRETRTFAHARVEVASGSRLRFREESTTLELERGRVQVEVDASRARTFNVLTRNFRVQVLGTAFSVSPERVQVRRGRVQVFDRRGRVLARELSQGATFTYRAPEEQGAQPSASSSSAIAPTQASSAELLGRARAALAAADVSAARAAIAQAEQLEPTRADRAEAHTLRAQCALLERDARAATRIYLEVAERFGDLAAGENAAYAAAQLTARAGDKKEAQSLFQRYLAQYPRGRFASEARARLAADQQ